MRAEASGSSPIVSAELPETGERFEGILPPVSLAPCFAIRKPATTTFRLADYDKAQIASPLMAKVLTTAVTDARSILIAGGTGSGKTTLANALLAEIAGLEERVVIIEDTRELRCEAKDAVWRGSASIIRDPPQKDARRSQAALRSGSTVTRTGPSTSACRYMV